MTSSKSAAPRGRYLAQVRLRHLCRAISVAHFGEVTSGYVGTSEDGHFWCHNGSGDHHLVVWSPRGVVALAFDHESPLSETNLGLQDRRPERVFAGAPSELAEEIAEACAWGERLATSGWWMFAPPGAPERTAGQVGSDQLRGYELTAAEALRGTAQHMGWCELDSISAAQGRLATTLAGETGRALTRTDAKVVLASPPRHGRAPRPGDVAASARLFAQAGFPWTDALDHLAEVQREKDEREGPPSPDVCLLRAAYGGDLEEVRRLLDAGANIDVRARVRDLPESSILARHTPLLVAISRRQWEIALLLIARGANPRAKVVETTPLLLAAKYGGVEVCRELLANGVELEPPDILADAGSSRTVEIVRLLLDAGAPLPNRTQCQGLARVAARAGAHDLIPRLLGPTEPSS